MVVDDDRIYPRDALAAYLHYSARLTETALCFRGAAMPRTFDWRDATMIWGGEFRKPRSVAVITGCGSYLIQPRFFDESLCLHAEHFTWMISGLVGISLAAR